MPAQGQISQLSSVGLQLVELRAEHARLESAADELAALQSSLLELQELDGRRQLVERQVLQLRQQAEQVGGEARGGGPVCGCRAKGWGRKRRRKSGCVHNTN